MSYLLISMNSVVFSSVIPSTDLNMDASQSIVSISRLVCLPYLCVCSKWGKTVWKFYYALRESDRIMLQLGEQAMYIYCLSTKKGSQQEQSFMRLHTQ